MPKIAIEEGADVLIDRCNLRNKPFQYIESTEISIENALDTAVKMQYMANTIKTHTVEVEAIFDNSLQGIIKIDIEGKITIVNKIWEELLNIKQGQVESKMIFDILPELKFEHVESILNGERDIFNTSFRIKDVPTMLTLVPIQESNEILGGIVTFYRLNLNDYDKEETRSLYLRGYITDSRFTQINVSDENMKECVENAEIFAFSKNPI